jgi:hypothetical protein
MPHLHESSVREAKRDSAWAEFCERVELASDRQFASAEDFACAYIAFCKGRTTSDYALEVVARAGEFL